MVHGSFIIHLYCASINLEFSNAHKHDMEVVRALAFHLCGLDSVTEPGTVWRVSCLVLLSSARGFSLLFPSINMEYEHTCPILRHNEIHSI